MKLDFCFKVTVTFKQSFKLIFEVDEVKFVVTRHESTALYGDVQLINNY